MNTEQTAEPSTANPVLGELKPGVDFLSVMRKAYFNWLMSNKDAFASLACPITAEQKTFELQLSLLSEVRSWGFESACIAVCTDPRFELENCGPSLDKFTKDHGSLRAKQTLIHPVVLVEGIVLDTCFRRLGSGIPERNNAKLKDYSLLWGSVLPLQTVKCPASVDELASIIRACLLRKHTYTQPSDEISSLSSAFSASKRMRSVRDKLTEVSI